MATFKLASAEQSTAEVRTWVVDYTDDLLTGVTVASGTAIHMPPSGSAGTPTCIVSSPKINVTLGPLAVTGMHYLEVRATLSDSEIASVTISIPVGYSTPTARSGMLDLIDTVRGMADVGPADFKIGATSYWSDAQIQKALDKHRIDIYQEILEPWPILDEDGFYEYYEYRTSRGNLESGTAVFIVQQTNGGTVPVYTADYSSGIITFTADTEGTISPMLTARSYDVHAAAADIWRGKAANAAKYFDFRTDNHQISKSQLYKQFMDMANFFQSQSDTQSFNVTQINRSDVNTGYEWE
jgi:hypothetical protein